MWGSSYAKEAGRVVSSLIQRANEHDVYEELIGELSATIDKLIAERVTNERIRWILALDAAASGALHKATGRERAVSVVNVVWEAMSGQEAFAQQTKTYRY